MVLMLTTVWPGGRRSGSELVSQAFVDELREAGHRVVVLSYLRPGDAGPSHADDHIAGVRPIETDDASAGQRVVWMLGALLARLPYSAAKYSSRAYRRLADRFLAEAPDVVVVDHAQMGWLLRGGADARSHVYLAHNVEHQLYAGQAAGGGGLRRLVYGREARQVRRLEGRLLGWAQHVWALSDDDAVALDGMGAPGRARAFGPPPAVTPSDGEPEADVVLLGRWTWAANAVGLEWFLDHVVDRLPETLTIRVAGAGAEHHRGRHPNVSFCGVVPDATAFLSTGRAIAIPARAGAGVQVKTLDAIATGRPVVATPLAVRGMREVPPSVLVADDPGDYASRLVAAVAEGPSPAAREAADAWVADCRRTFTAAIRTAIAEALAHAR